MKLLLDTHLLLWAAGMPDRLSPLALELLNDPDNELVFSVASLWEIVIKRGLERPDFQVEPGLLRRGLLENGYRELAISGAHALAVGKLPPIHKDPFDRMLVAQAETEGLRLLTTDTRLAQYDGPIERV